MNIRYIQILGVSLILGATASGSVTANAQKIQGNQPKAKAIIARAGNLCLEEYRQTKVINLDVSQSKLFKIGSYIIRTSVGDPSIAEPVVLCENQFVVLGRAQGTTTLVLWSDDNQVAVMKVHVINKQATQSTDTGKRINASQTSPQPATLTLRACNLSAKMEKELRQFLASWHARNQFLQEKKYSPAISQPEPGYVLFIGDTVGSAMHIKLGTKEEFNSSLLNKPKATKSIDIALAQTRTFRTKNKIVKATLIKPQIAEPVIVSGREVVIVGKALGQATLILQDGKNNSETIELNCIQKSETGSSKDETFDQSRKGGQVIPFVSDQPLNLVEKGVSEGINLPITQPKCFHTNNEIVRAVICDSAIAELYFSESRQVVFAGIAPGKTTIFLWDDKGNSTGINLLVTDTGAGKLSSGASDEAAPSPDAQQDISNSSNDSSHLAEIEYWTGSKKDVFSVPRSKSDK